MANGKLDAELGRVDGILVPGRLRHPRRGRDDRGDPLRARDARSRSSASASGCSARSSSARATCAGLTRRRLDGVQRGDAAHGDLQAARPAWASTSWAARCGSAPTRASLAEGSFARQAYGDDGDLRAPPPPLRGQPGVPAAARRRRACRCRGLSPDGKFVEIVEYADHPWFLACQFHPEYKSRPLAPAPAVPRVRRGGLPPQAGAPGARGASRTTDAVTANPTSLTASPPAAARRSC